MHYPGQGCITVTETDIVMNMFPAIYIVIYKKRQELPQDKLNSSFWKE